MSGQPNERIFYAASFFIHAFAATLMFVSLPSFVKDDFQEIDVVLLPPKDLRDKIKPMQATNTSPSGKGRPTSGISRNSTVDSEAEMKAKIGNTLMKAPDTLPPTDEGLPPPVDDFEVTAWPSLKNDVRIPYPSQARSQEIEGVVVMDLYISENGEVKKSDLVSGPGFGLNEAAIKAAKTFLFEPARVQGKPVPVVIRYSYKFVIQR